MKRLPAVLLTLSLSLSSFASAYALTDSRIFADYVQNTYTGRTEAAQMIANLSFTDLPSGSAARESIARAGAFNMVKGCGKNFNPGGAVSNQEALAFVLRALGEEQTAQGLAVGISQTMPAGSALRTLWSLGYLSRAQQMGLITATQYDDALVTDQTQLDPANSFLRGAPATREHVADWIVRGLESADPNAFLTTATQQSLYRHPDWENVSINAFPDWETVSVNMAANVEKALKAGFFRGVASSGSNLKPKGNITRAEMAQVLANMDTVYFNTQGLTKKTGTVGGIKDAQTSATGTASLTRDIYVRAANGGIDILRYTLGADSSPQTGDMDMVVFKDGAVASLSALAEGDQIEYVVREQDKVGFYVQVVSSELVANTVRGVWKSIDWDNGTITITDPATTKEYTYPMATGVFGQEEDGTQYVIVDEKRRAGANIPVGSIIDLSLKNNIIDAITYVGETALVTEARGIIIENNPEMGYLTYFDKKGNTVTKNFYDGDIKVKKLPHYEKEDAIGYISQVFPDFRYNPADAAIDEVEPGDIVFMRFDDPDDPERITAISASPSYVVRYGKILEFTDNGEFHTMTVEYENKATSWFDVPNDIFIMKDGRPSDPSDVKVGDWARMLVNVAILEPGNVMESVKEMTIEGDGHFVSNIIKGQLAGINAVQYQLLVKNAQKLTKTGWANHKNVEKYSLSGKDIEYYQDGKRVSQDYAMQYLKRAKGEVYIALENNYSGEKVRKVTFRSGRDELLKPDTIMAADGNGGFTMLSVTGAIETDPGTIVRRHGRLVTGGDIRVPDYAVVSLNGQGKAAVVDIYDAPDTSAVFIIRGRIKTISDGKSFVVQSMAMLNMMDWNYTPVEREFTIDYDTIFMDESGVVPDETFLTYGDASVYDKVFNVIATGSHADRVIDAPYATRGVRGTVYEAGGGALKLKDASYYDNDTGKWLVVSEKNNTLTVTLAPNTIVAANNVVVAQNTLKAGDKIKAMAYDLPQRVLPDTEITAYIVHVEK